MTRTSSKSALTRTEIQHFRNKIRGFYRRYQRPFPWRETQDSYAILISEIMLQQTQTARVLPFYTNFLKKFPNFQTLSKAPLKEVLKAWQGLGYNRRAKMLWQLSQVIHEQHKDVLPQSIEELRTLPGIGAYTAGALLVFAFDRPSIMIETNIRAVIIHEFFADQAKVSDDQIRSVLEQVQPQRGVREWYYALMDYGVYLKAQRKVSVSRSSHYRPQSKFKGSRRELRGAVLRLLNQNNKMSAQKIAKETGRTVEDVKDRLGELQREGFVLKQGSLFLLI